MGLSLTPLFADGSLNQQHFLFYSLSVKYNRIKRTLSLWNMYLLSIVLFFPAGGAISNMYSVMIARYKFFPEVKTKGMAAAPRLVLFTSEHVSLPPDH